MQFKISRNKEVVLNGLHAESFENAAKNMEKFLKNIGIEITEIDLEIDNCAVLYFIQEGEKSRYIISQDKTAKAQSATDADDLTAIVVMDNEKKSIVCSTIKASSRRAAKAPDAIRRQFSELGGKFKEMTITKKAGWQFLPEKEDQLRALLVDAGIAIEA